MLNSISKGIFLFSFKLSERGRVVVLVSYGNNSFGSFPYGTNFDSIEAATDHIMNNPVYPV